jgi:biopolymer transport protein TolQ
LSQIGIWNLLANSSLFSKTILLMLLLFSVATWAITLNKHWQFRACVESYMRAINILRPSADIQALYTKIVKEIGGPAGRIFEEGYLTLAAFLETQIPGKARYVEASFGANLTPERDLHLRLQTALGNEISHLSGGLTFLGTTTTVSPFLGLMGTVWGIMYTFLSIGQSGSAELAVVAPGIAEALITTIAGLLVAIPALICNNHLTTRLAKIEDYLSRLQTELDIYFMHSWFREKAKIESRLGYQRDAAR